MLERRIIIKNLIRELYKTIQFAINDCGNASDAEVEFMILCLKQARDMNLHKSECFNIDEVCKELQISPSTVYEWMRRGWLHRPTKYEKTYCFWTKKDVEDAKKNMK